MDPKPISEHLTPVIQMVNQGLAKLEPKGSPTGVEKQFVKSIKKIATVHRPIEDLTEVLRYVMMKVGIRGQNLPSEMETQVLIDHIMHNYGNHSHEEIKLAFDLAITGKIGTPGDKGEDFSNCFENFTCQYFSKIMNAYREWAAKAYKAVVKEMEPEQEKEDLSDKTMQDMWEYQRQKIREGLKPEFAYTYLYDWKNSKGDINKAEKPLYFKKAVDHILGDLTEKYKTNQRPEMRQTIEDFKQMKELSVVKAHYVDMVGTMAKRLMVYQMMVDENSKSDSDRAGDIHEENMGDKPGGS